MSQVSVYSLVPDATTLLGLSVEELSWVVLRALQSRVGRIHYGNFAGEAAPYAGSNNYPPERAQQIQHAIMEAWAWLQANGMIAMDPESGREGWYFVTRRGQAMQTDEQFKEYRFASLFPRALFHNAIADNVWIDFAKGEYDTAVFKAFKEVEIAVRKGGSFGDEDFGTDLMRKAFHKDTGPLTAIGYSISLRFCHGIALAADGAAHTRDCTSFAPPTVAKSVTRVSRSFHFVPQVSVRFVGLTSDS